MNTLDYLLLAALAAGTFYSSYRLFLGYILSRSGEFKAADDMNYRDSSRAEKTAADFKH